jgi:RNA polymerase primary sigma factor
MKAQEVKKIITKAHEVGTLSLDQLDRVLNEDSTFEKNVKSLIKHLDQLPVRESSPAAAERSADEYKLPSRKRSSSDQLLGYFRDVNHRPRMSRQDEIRYSKRLEFLLRRLIQSVQTTPQSREIQNLIRQMKDFPGDGMNLDILPLSSALGQCPDGEARFIQKCYNTYILVRADFVERNLHHVVSLTGQYRTYGIPMMDLIQEGNTAMIRAVEKYDWRKGVRFRTYATFWIKQAVERFITANKGIVRVPNYLQQKMRRFKREGIIGTEGPDISVKEISDTFELSHEVAGHLIETGLGHVSLDAPASEDDDNSISDTLYIEDEEVVLDGESQKLKKRLKEVLSVLNDQEQFILKHRFGLEGKEIKTLEEIGNLMRVSRERIRQLQLRALAKLKRPSLVERLVPFLP